MAHHVDQDGKLNVEIFKISEDYQYLDNAAKFDILHTIKDWAELEIIKIEFSDDSRGTIK
jgi:hypothetical protein